MKYIKLFENFSENLEKTVRKLGITGYTINDDGSVDVDGDVDLSNRYLTKIPVKFGKVTGNFYMWNNKLKTLEGSPYYVGENFNVSLNELKDLKGSPKEVGGSFYASSNRLETVEGMPLEIGSDFFCAANFNLTTLDSMSNIEGYIDCSNTKIDIKNSGFKGYCKEIVKEI
jgi:hypothetical protein